MYDIFIICVVSISSIWVYWDATSNKIGKIPHLSAFLNMSAGAWALLTLPLWTFVFPLYLFKRTSLIIKAEEHPVTANNTGIKLSLLSIVSALLLSMALYTFYLPVLPKCDDTATQEYLAKSFNKWHKGKASAERFQTLSTIKELDYNEENLIRSCKAILFTSERIDAIQYHVGWMGGKNNLFFVNFRYL
jgi:hypothetical protein